MPFELCAVAFDPRRRSFRRVFALYRERTRQGKIQRSHSLFTICSFFVGGYRFSVCAVRRFLQPQKMVLPQRLGKSTCIISFAGEKFSVRLKVFYFFFFKKLMTALCLVAAEIPFLLCSLVFYRELSEKGLYKTVFAGAVVLCSVLFLLGLYFGAVLSKTFWLCEKVYFKNKKCSVALAVNKSKSLTEGNRFRLVNYNISFAWRILFCIFLIPLFYTVPYISQSNGLLCREFIGKYRQGAAFPVVFMKLQKT